ncbi:DJ-1/PfpI family protein [Azospirillum sp. ST 5-10]|uniref:DJ-1/PfpI family protein n=1 Tax=unclassified Azospirillum TaxID=2630922 RepID=UPI003F49C036
MTEKRILIVTTSHREMGGSGHQTGLWLEELATPYYAFLDAGAEVVLASVAGGEIPFDPRSLPAAAGGGGGEEPATEQAVPPSVHRFLGDRRAMEAARTTPSVTDVSGRPCDALFLPGGHGTMWDYPTSDTLALLVGSYLDDGRVVAAVCHGPAGLVAAKTGDGRPVVAGRRVSGFTDSEEQAVGLADVVPFLLERRLRELGGRFERGPDWQPFAVRDGTLITGQNPQSSELVAHHVLVALGLGLDPAIADEQRVRERAYEIWEAEGHPHGRHEAHWAQAIRDVNAEGARPGQSPERGRQGGTVVEGVEAGGDRYLGGAGTTGTLKTPRP